MLPDDLILSIYPEMGAYPSAWTEGKIQALIRKMAGHCCEECGIDFHEGTNTAKTAVRRDGKPMIGTVHHLNGKKEDCRWENLVFLCQRCHLFVQAWWAPGGPLPQKWDRVPQWIVSRDLDYVPHLQLSLFEIEVE